MTEQTNQMEHVKVLIIGSGPAGYTAALYTGRASLQPVLYCGPLTGGQLTQTTEIENFPGYPQGVDANQMMLEFREQAERFGADIRDGEVESCDFSQRPYRVKFTDGTQMTADTVIIATGASAKYLGLDDEKKYAGQGVSACAVCDGFFYRKKRKGEADESRYDLPIDGFFLAIGHHPNTDFLGGQIDLDEMGFIVTKGKSQATNIPGVYAAGDVCDPTYRQAIVAAGAGCKAALEAERYLQTL